MWGGQRRYCLCVSQRCSWMPCHAERGSTMHRADLEVSWAILVMVVKVIVWRDRWLM